MGGTLPFQGAKDHLLMELHRTAERDPAKAAFADGKGGVVFRVPDYPVAPVPVVTPGAEKGERGKNGDTGATGPAGAAATIEVRAVTTGAPGSPAEVTNSGTSSAAVLDFAIPAGADGSDGLDGADGIDGNDGIPTALAAIGSTPNANGMTLAGSTVNLEPASASFGGVVTTGAQTIAGAKTLTSRAIVQLTTEQFRVGYDASNYCSFTVASTGQTTVDLVGSSPVFFFADPVCVGTSTSVYGKLQAYDGGSGASISELLCLKTTYTSSGAAKSLTWRDATNITGQIDTGFDGTRVSMRFGSLYNSGYNSTVLMTLDGRGLGVGATPAATLTLKAGVAAAGGAPILLTSGTNLTAAVNGAVEYNGTNLFFTRASTTRESVWCGNSGATAPATNTVGVIVDYFGTSATRVLTTPNSWASVNIGGTAYKIPLYS